MNYLLDVPASAQNVNFYIVVNY